jgi:hypothetical protein
MSLSDTALSTVLQVSITGAGLLLAVYALIIPVSRKIFISRALYLFKEKAEFEKKRQNLTANAEPKDFQELQRLTKEIKEVQEFPPYLGTGVIFSFTSYIISSIISWLALFAPSTNSIIITIIIGTFFLIANLLFALIGAFTVGVISQSMEKEYIEIKKKLENKSKDTNLEELAKIAETLV